VERTPHRLPSKKAHCQCGPEQKVLGASPAAVPAQVEENTKNQKTPCIWSLSFRQFYHRLPGMKHRTQLPNRSRADGRHLNSSSVSLTVLSRLIFGICVTMMVFVCGLAGHAQTLTNEQISWVSVWRVETILKKFNWHVWRPAWELGIAPRADGTLFLQSGQGHRCVGVQILNLWNVLIRGRYCVQVRQSKS
jgi:hypothetical protein